MANSVSFNSSLGEATAQWKRNLSSPEIEALTEFVASEAIDTARGCTCFASRQVFVATVDDKVSPVRRVALITPTRIFLFDVTRSPRCLCCTDTSVQHHAHFRIAEMQSVSVQSTTSPASPPTTVVASLFSTFGQSQSNVHHIDAGTVGAAHALAQALIEQRTLLTCFWPWEIGARYYVEGGEEALQAQDRRRIMQQYGTWGPAALLSQSLLECVALEPTKDPRTASLIAGRRGGQFAQTFHALRTQCDAYLAHLSTQSSQYAQPGPVSGELPPALDIQADRVDLEYGILSYFPMVDGLVIRGNVKDHLATACGGIGHPNVRRLQLEAHGIVDWDLFFTRLQRFGPGVQPTPIHTLHLNGSPIPTAVLGRLFVPQYLPLGLVELSLKNASLTEDSAQLIAKFLRTSPTLVRVLRLDGNSGLGSAGMDVIGHALIQRRLPLTLFTLSNCGTVLGQLAMRALAMQLQFDSSLNRWSVCDPETVSVLQGSMVNAPVIPSEYVTTRRSGSATSPLSAGEFSALHVLLRPIVSPPPLGVKSVLSFTDINVSEMNVLMTACNEVLIFLERAQAANQSWMQRHATISIVAHEPQLVSQLQQLANLVLLTSVTIRGGTLADCGASIITALPLCEELRYTNPRTPGKAAPQALYAALTTPGIKLRLLDLTGCSGGDVLVCSIGAALKINRTVQTVLLNGNHSTDAGWLALRKSLYGNKKLIVLDFQRDCDEWFHQLQLRINSAAVGETDARQRMKMAFKYRRQYEGRQQCNIMVQHKATQRTLGKQKNSVSLLVQQIQESLKKNSIVNRPKFVKAMEQENQRAQKRAQRAARDEEAWNAKQSRIWERQSRPAPAAVPKSKPTSQNVEQQPKPVRRTSGPPPPQQQRQRPKSPPAAAALKGAPWAEVRAAGTYRTPASEKRRILLMLGHRIDSYVERHVQLLAAGNGAFASADLMLPTMEATYQRCHHAYVSAMSSLRGFPLPSGWVATRDAFGNGCFAHSASGIATYQDPRLHREVADYVEADADVGQTLFAVWMHQQPELRDLSPLEVYACNLYLCLYFQDFSFPLPPHRRPFLYNIPILDDATRSSLRMADGQSPVVYTDPPRALRAPQDGLVMTPRLFCTLNGLIGDLLDSIQSTSFAVVEDTLVAPYWQLPSEDMRGTALFTSSLLEAPADQPALRGLQLLQELYRQIEFNQLPPEFVAARDTVKQNDPRRQSDGGIVNDDDYCFGGAAAYLAQRHDDSGAVCYVTSVLPIDQYGGSAAAPHGRVGVALLQEDSVFSNPSSNYPERGGLQLGLALPVMNVATVAVPSRECQKPSPSANDDHEGAEGQVDAVDTDEENDQPDPTPGHDDRCGMDDASSPSTPNESGKGHAAGASDTALLTLPTAVSYQIDPTKDTRWQEILIQEYVKAPARFFPSVRIRTHRCVSCRLHCVVKSEARAVTAVVTQCSVDRLQRLRRLGTSLKSALPLPCSTTATCAASVEPYGHRDPCGQSAEDEALTHVASPVVLVASVLLDGASSEPAVVQELRELAQSLVRAKHCAAAVFLLVRPSAVVGVEKQGDGSCLLYPVNALRNLATDYAKNTIRAELGILLDVDFAVRGDLFDPARSALVHTVKGRAVARSLLGLPSRGDAQAQPPIAVVLPAFELVDDTTTTTEAGGVDDNEPKTKESLLQCIATGRVESFHCRHYPAGHGPSDLSRWKSPSGAAPDDSSFYRATYDEGYEPYLIVSLRQGSGEVALPSYDARFVGYGLNKVQHALHLHHLGYEFLVCPDTFVVAAPHERSESWQRTFNPQHQEFVTEQRIIVQALYRRFKKELAQAAAQPVSPVCHRAEERRRSLCSNTVRGGSLYSNEARGCATSDLFVSVK